MSELRYRQSLKNVPVYKAGTSTLNGFDNPVKISSNENAYGTSPVAVDAYHQSATDLFKYPNGDAVILKNALVKHYNVNYDNVICGAGSDNIIELCCFCFLETGDEGIFSTHSFPVYDIAIRIAGGVPVTVPYRDDLSHDIDGIIQAVTDKTKIIFIANPDNPTGLHVSRSEVERLIASVPKSVLIVLDEAYYEFATADDYRHGLDLVEHHENVVVTRTFSKMFGLAALRVGWGYLSNTVMDALSRARSPFNVCIPAQYAAAAILSDTDWQADNLDKNIKQRIRLESFFAKHHFRYIPSQANFVLVNFADAVAVDKILKENGIIVRHMTGNGMPDYLRFSLGTAEQMDIVLSVLEKIPEDLK